MASTTFPSVPPILKPLQSFMKIASDLEKLDAVIAYWVRFYVVQNGLKIDSKSKESIGFLTVIMNWLEKACNQTFN
jgi:vacuolar protein sorting-associated protein VTA1